MAVSKTYQPAAKLLSEQTRSDFTGTRKEAVGDYVTIEEEEAGVHFLMHLRTELKEESIVTQAKPVV